MVRPVKLIQTIHGVLRRMTVNHVQEHCDAHAMCGIYQLFQVFWGAEPAARGEKAVDLVAKARVICMLHYGHQLYDVVSKMFYPRQHVLREFFIGCDA